MRVVIDTNVVVSRFLSPEGSPAHILRAWKQGEFELLLSEDIVSEYQRVLSAEDIRARHQLTDQELKQVIDDFREFATLIAPQIQLEIIKEDPKDDMFLACAVEGEAAYVVSGDKHLLRLKAYQGMHIITPAMFLAVLRREIN